MIEIELKHRYVEENRLKNRELISLTIDGRLYKKFFDWMSRLALKYGYYERGYWTIDDVKIIYKNKEYKARVFIGIYLVKFSYLELI